MTTVTQADFDRMKIGAWRKGHLVTHRSNGDLYLVTKVANVNLQVLGTDGKAYNLRKTAAVPAPVGTTWEDEAPEGIGEDTLGNAYPGAVVAFKIPSKKSLEGRWVITNGNSESGFRLHSLGGSSSYLTGVMGHMLKPVDVRARRNW